MRLDAKSRRQKQASKIIKMVKMQVGYKDKPKRNNGLQINCNNKNMRANGSDYQVKGDSIMYGYVVR